jgi:hypothetical protein
MINLSEDPRAALELTRYHSWRRLRDQSVGEHSCQIMRILLTVWPDCPRRMLVYAVTHDMGEMAGDIQYPYKLKYPELKPLMDRVEKDVVGVMRDGLGAPPAVMLSKYELDVFKIVEFVEMFEYGLSEQGMGNQYARIISSRCILAASELMGRLEPGDALDIRPAIKRYVDARAEWEGQNQNTTASDKKET